MHSALASGCSLFRCIAAAISSTPSSSAPANVVICRTRGCPRVSVPVLSKTIRLSTWASSSVETSRIKIPARAAAPVPVIIAVGVANPNAHGHAMTNTATAASNAASRSPYSKNQPVKVMPARIRTSGTNHTVIRSTKFCTRALPSCALSTNRTIVCSAESSPTANVSISNMPLILIEPPVTVSPCDFSSGTLSPVISDSSTSASP